MLSGGPQEYELMPTGSRASITSQQQTWSQRHLKGWRFGILSGAVLASAVLCVNLGFTIYGGIESRTEDASRKLLYRGNCDQAARINLAAHLLINVLSTLLLSASNYGMQCLSAPTRKEIDAAHAKKIWLDIGVLSVKNLSKISTRRTVLWALLGLSSFPLHLFYNSAVYSSIYAYNYKVFLTTEAILQNSSPQPFLNQSTGLFSNDNYTSFYMWSSYQANNLTRMSNSDCINAYAATFQTSYGNVILVAEGNSSTSYVDVDPEDLMGISGGCDPDPFSWICGRTSSSICYGSACSTKSVDSSNWNPFGSQIKYCLIEPVEQKCEIQFVPMIAYAVIAFNLFKTVILLYTFFLIEENPLMTVGDAISSFLRRKDETTIGLCLMSKADIAWWKSSRPVARPFKSKPKRWGGVVSKKRWFVIVALYTVILSICIFLFWFGIADSGFSASTMMSIGIGAIDPRTFIFWNLPGEGISGLLSNTFVANSPQPILSMIYYTYNGLLTCFLLAVEWNGFARSRKGLRVTTPPTGLQRSSYTLQLPKRWALPLMGLSALLHWLCSQSIFLVSIQIEERFHGQDYIDEYITCAYSPVAIISTVGVGVIMLVFAICMGLRKFRSPEMPVVGSCSAAISASCHLLEQNQSLSSSSAMSPDDQSAPSALPYYRPYLSPIQPAGYSYPTPTYSNSYESNPVANPSRYYAGYASPGNIENEGLLDHGAPMGSTRRSMYSINSYETGYDTACTGHDVKDGPEVGAEACQLTVMWGAIEDGGVSTSYVDERGQPVKRRIRHCGFSSRLVEAPVEGELYAGVKAVELAKSISFSNSNRT